MCPFGYNKILSDPDITIFIDWLKNDQLIQQDNRITYFTEAVLIQGTPVYYGQLDYEYVTLSDSGLYHCIVYTTANPPINTQYITNNTITSTILNITIEGNHNNNNNNNSDTFYTLVFDNIIIM